MMMCIKIIAQSLWVPTHGYYNFSIYTFVILAYMRHVGHVSYFQTHDYIVMCSTEPNHTLNMGFYQRNYLQKEHATP